MLLPILLRKSPIFLGYFCNLIPHLRPKSHPHLIISSTTFIQSLSEVICACVIRVGELDRCQFWGGGQMIGIDLLSSCIDFNDKAATVFRVFMFNCMGSKTLFLKVLSKIYARTTIATSMQRCYASSFSHSSINFSFSW